jgi:hypothetical protein
MGGTTIRLGILFAEALVCADGQWLNYPNPGTPRTRDGKANLSAPAPRVYKGKPDFSGVWQIEPPPPGEVERVVGVDFGSTVVPGDDPRSFSKYFFNILADFKPEEAPMTPEGVERFRQTAQGGGAGSTESRCLPIGIPRVGLASVPFKMIQAPGSIVMIYEADNTHRQVFIDGRKLPVDPDPAWMGYSVGKWEGDTLVVDTAGFNDKTWLDGIGHPRSESMHLTERFRRRDFGHMEMQVTVDDPKNYTRAFTIKVNMRLLADSDVLQYFCAENERDLAHLPGQ